MNKKLAKLRYLPNNFQIIEKGDYVVCAISRKKINLDNLNYWNVELQEPYFSYVEDSKKKEGKRLTNAFNTVSDNSTAIEGALTKEAANSAEAKVHYAKALPFAVKGLLGTVQLPPEAKSLLDTIKADKMAALKLGDFVKVLPKIPEYVKSATTVGKLITSGAKSRDVKGADDANKALGDL